MARARYLPGQTVKFQVKRNRGRRTIGGYLASRLFIHDNRALALLRQNCVRVNNDRIAPDTIIDLKAGSIIEITFPEAWPPYMQPTAMELDIIFEDSALIALNKPAGRVVHPSCGHLTGKTLQNGVLHRYKDLQYPDKMISPAHRLDRYTTGVIIYSRTREAYRELTRFFRENSAHKTYLAITEGAPNWDELKIDAPIAELPENPELRWVAPIGSSKNAKAALTRFRVLERGKNWSLLEAVPVTGRSHQIRAHLKHLQLPIICDHEYNPHGRKLTSLSFQALHARELRIRHPLTDKPLILRAAIPQAFQEALIELKTREK